MKNLTFRLDAGLRDAEFSGVARRVLDGLTGVGFPPDTWSIPIGGKPRRTGFEAALKRLDADSRANRSIEWQLGPDSYATLHRLQEGPGLQELSLWLGVRKLDAQAQGTRLEAQIRLAAELLEEGMLESARIYRQGDGGDQLPGVPIVWPNSYAVAATADEVAACYEAPDVFWRLGWEVVAERQGRKLLARHRRLLDPVAFMTAAWPEHWALARAAKPGVTQYYFNARLATKEKALVNAGRDTLEPIDYDAAEARADYSCYLDPDEHVQGREVLALARMLSNKRGPRGRKVERARVIFPDRATAQRERRPLLDAGAEVLYYDEEGELAALAS